MFTAKEVAKISDNVRTMKLLFEQIKIACNNGEKSLIINNFENRNEDGHIFFDLDKEHRQYLEDLGFFFDRGENHDNEEIGHADYDDEFICW